MPLKDNQVERFSNDEWVVTGRVVCPHCLITDIVSLVIPRQHTQALINIGIQRERDRMAASRPPGWQEIPHPDGPDQTQSVDPEKENPE